MRKILLPSAILILISNHHLDDAVFAVECLEGMIRWLLDEVDDIVKFQKKILPQKSKKFDQPRIYILKALPKPQSAKNSTLFKGVRRRFNNALQTMLEGYPNFGFINIHEITTREKDEIFFISPDCGTLSDEGKIQFWDSISQTFKAIDNKIKPKAITKSKASQCDWANTRKENTFRNPEFRDDQRRSYDNNYAPRNFNDYYY